MHLLLDHGSSDNFGDGAMLAGVLEQYSGLPGSRVTVVHRPGFNGALVRRHHYEVESLPNLKGVEPRNLPRLANSLLYRTPLVWKYVRNLNETAARWSVRPRFARCDDAASWTLCEGANDRSYADTANRFDGLHLVGGGYLTDAFPEITFQKCCLIHAFAAAGKPVILTGQQIGPLHRRPVREAVYRALRRTSFVGLRGATQSADHCRAARLDGGRFAVTGDDSFGVAADADLGEAIVGDLGLSPGEFIAVNLRQARYAGQTTRDVQRFAALCAAISTQCRAPLLFVPIARNNADGDAVTFERLQKLAPRLPLQILPTERLDVEDLKGVMAASAVAVGSSYHFATFARSCGVPAVSVGTNPYYDQKAQGLAAFWRTGVVALSLRDCQPNEVAAQVATMMRGSERGEHAASAAAAVERWKTFVRRRLESLVGVAAAIA